MIQENIWRWDQQNLWNNGDGTNKRWRMGLIFIARIHGDGTSKTCEINSLDNASKIDDCQNALWQVGHVLQLTCVFII